jgi:hypothetical protein
MTSRNKKLSIKISLNMSVLSGCISSVKKMNKLSILCQSCNDMLMCTGDIADVNKNSVEVAFLPGTN